LPALLVDCCAVVNIHTWKCALEMKGGRGGGGIWVAMYAKPLVGVHCDSELFSYARGARNLHETVSLSSHY